MADEEPVNPQLEVEESCKPQCVKLLLEYQVRGCGRARCPGWACSDRLQQGCGTPGPPTTWQ